MSNLRKDLELIEVNYANDKKKVVLTFLDIENGEVLEVNFNKQAYIDDQFVDDEEKENQVIEWCKEYFNTTFDKLPSKIGVKKDVYRYDRFNSLWEVMVVEKFTKDDEGKIIQTQIKAIEDDGKGIRIAFEHDGKEYESKMMYAEYVETLKKWFTNPQKKARQKAKFEKKFGVPVVEADTLIGKDIIVEVKLAFGKFPYAEIKKPAWTK